MYTHALRRAMRSRSIFAKRVQHARVSMDHKGVCAQALTEPQQTLFVGLSDIFWTCEVCRLTYTKIISCFVDGYFFRKKRKKTKKKSSRWAGWIAAKTELR